MTRIAFRKSSLLSAALIAAALIASRVATAQTLTVGSGGGDNAFPFFAGYRGEYQQVYNSGVFTGAAAGPVIITQIAFASAGTQPNFTFTGSFGLGTTGATPSSPGTSYAGNKRADFTTVFTGTQTAVLTGTRTFDLIFNVTPFVYDPANGNLLLDVVTSGGNGSTYFDSSVRGTADPNVGRLFNSSGNGAATPDPNFGLRTRFTYTAVTASAVPEPSEYAMAGMFGATLLFGMVKARRKKATASA